jgi:peptidoglycan/LPS O-acetylase OafA/YrhL
MGDAGLQATLRRVFGNRRSSAGESFLAVDGLRGFAVLLVLLGHIYRGGVAVFPQLTMTAAGASGVELFFVLSSFLLSTPLTAASPSELRSPGTWTTYAARRLLRIYPLYIVVLLVGTSVPAWSLALFGPREVSIVDHLTWQQGAKIMWAIPVEMKFYVLLPVLAVVLSWALRRSAALALLLVAAMLATSAMLVPPRVPGPPTILLAPQLPYFVSGLAAAVVHRLWRPTTTRARVTLDVAGWSALAWWASGNLFAFAPAWAAPFQEPAWRGLTLALLTLAAVDARLGLSALFRLAPLRFLGVISFSVYLLHMPIVESLRKVADWSDVTKTVAIVAAVCATSMVSYLLIELPFIEVGRKLSRRPGRANAHSSSMPL